MEDHLNTLNQVGRSGELRLSFARRGERTVLLENYSRPPLQVMRPIPDATGCLCIYLLSPSGGVLQDDRYNIQIQVGANTHALFTTPSANRVYRMPTGYAEQKVFVTIEQQGILEFVPDATILFADADWRQTTEVTLAPGALLILHEIIMPGRFAHGEYLQFRNYQNRLIVRDAAGLILYDAARIEPAQQNLERIGWLEGYRCWGSLYVLGDLERWHLNAAQFCRDYGERLTTVHSIGALSPLHRNGFTARMLSQRLETIHDAFGELRQTVRGCIGLTDAKLRK
ncbi:MAG: urease accessory protein UreD [Anaerolineae bacterium]|nr:urease accessory protein UreD [Anaerolineae bacterium]